MRIGEDHRLDHGDEPITLEEVLESIKRNPVSIRVRLPEVGVSARVIWHPDMDAPDNRRPRRLLDVDDWT